MTFSKEDLISKILKKKESKVRASSDSAGNYPALKHSGKKRGLLSPAQRRIYVLSQMNGQKDIAYNLPEVLKIKGEFTAEQAQNTIEQVVQRHDILRTAFIMEEGKIYQEVHESIDFNVEHVDITACEFDGWLQNFIRPFDLTQPCLLRCALVNTEADRFLVFDSHHIIGDGFSAGIINKEFALAAQGHKLAFTRFQYLDYVDWVDQLASSATFKKQEEFWLKTLSRSIPVLDLPLDYARPDRKDFLGATVEFSLGKNSTALRALFRSEKVTLFTGLISAYAVFLSKITQQEDIFIATPVVNRPLPDMQNLPGMFVNTLPVITNPTSDMHFVEFLHQVKMSAFACQQNADCDISHIVEKLGIKRNAARNPLFDTLFVLQVKNLDMFNDTSIGIEPHSFNRGRSQFDLSLEAVERGEEIVFKMDYATALFSENTILRFRDQFLTLVENLIATPHAKIKELALINQQQAQNLIQWNCPIQQHEMHPISDVFEKMAAQRGNETALIFEGETLSYKDLAQKVQNLAFYLRSLGICRGDYVCLLQERSFDMIIAIFAVIKTGAAYVPIDPDYPDERVKFTIENCGAKFVITQPEVAQQKSALIAELSVELIEDISTHLEGNHQLETVNDVADVMYIIYTSGTTGVPKGVMVEHRCLYALLNGNKKLNFSADDRWVLFHSYAFDVSVWEIFASLLNGSSLLIPPKKITRDTQAFRRLVRDAGITVLNQTPSAFYRFAEVENECDDHLSLRWVNFAGEALLPGRLAKWQEKYPDTALINMYGITETTIHTSYKKLTRSDIENGECSNIGVSLDSLLIYLLDKDRNLCAPGVIGEIYVGGWGVARGYLNRPELNAERFIADPFVEGARLYKSGDLAKWTHNNELEYLGRNDQQVKIRGYRIECGEIENRIIKLCNAESAAVFDKKDSRGEKYLCAVIKSAHFTDEDTAWLKQELLGFLPAYMIPTQIAAIDEMPLTSNGKLDKRKLVEYLDQFVPETTYVAPQTLSESILAGIWSGYFPKVGAIGRDHDFFELGGHSLLAIELLLDIKKSFDKDVALETIFNYSSLSALAEKIDQVTGLSVVESIQPAPVQEHYEASSAQQRLFFIDQLTPSPGIAYNVPLVYEVTGQVNTDALQKNLHTLVSRHEALRTRFGLVDGSLKQIICNADIFTLGLEDSTSKTDQEIIGEFIKPFDLQKDALFRATLATNTNNSRALLLLDFHHIICDGLSLNVFIAELNQLFSNSKLAGTPVQYKDFCHWWSAHPNLAGDNQYWLQQLQGVPQLDLYTDFPRATAHSFAGGEIRFGFDAEHEKNFAAFCSAHKVTAYMAYMGVLSLLLSKLSGQDDVVIGSPFSGRPHADLQNTLGMFISSLPIRCQPHAQQTFAEYLQTIRTTCLDAQEHPFFQFEEVASRLGATKDIARNPIFDCMFDMQIADFQALEIPGATLSPMTLANPTAKIDLVFSIRNAGANNTETECILSFATGLYKQETVETIAQCFRKLMTQCLAAPSTLLVNLNLSSGNETNSVFERADNLERIAAGYWQRNLAGIPELLELPTDYPRSLLQNHTTANYAVEFNSTLTDKLKNLGSRHHTTLFTTLLSSWAGLLARQSGQDDIVIGSPVDGKTLALRFQVDLSKTVANLLAQSEQQVVAAQHYNVFSFNQLIDLVKPPVSEAYNPVFQVMFAWQDSQAENGVVNCDLRLNLSEQNNQIVGELIYSTALFDEDTIARHISHWTTMLDAMVENDYCEIGELPLLNLAQRQQILVNWNATDIAYPKHLCVHEIFEKQVSATPDAIALVCEEQRISYAELNERANQLAYHLREQGVVPDSRVAICVERSIEMVVAVLATMKAGGAYVPLDPAYPIDRLAFMLADSDPVVTLTKGSTTAMLAGLLDDTVVVDLDADKRDWSIQPESINPALDVVDLNAQHLVYVIYTSGSTGKPKGVMATHQSLVNMAMGLRSVLGINASSHCLQFASFSFDACIYEITTSLLFGATLYLPPKDRLMVGDELVAFAAKHDITHATLPPAVLNAMPDDAHLDGIQVLVVAGEASSEALVKRWAPGRRLINAYGPTEITVCATAYDCNVADHGQPAIGRAVANTKLYILDGHLQPVPVGVIGELYIGGAGVARGYLNRPELTAERFLVDPFAAIPHARMYKTGDLVRYRADGNVEYIGRNDFQVKIRGFRIELGEIEAKLAALENIVDAAVIVRDDNGDKRLVAYVTTRDAQPLDVAATRTALAADLSDYMIPNAFVQLQSMPLTPNGKLDRKVLPAPESGAYISQVYEAPVGETEIAVSEIWSTLLKQEQVGRHDNFFDLGGHSLLAVQLLSRIRQSLNVEVTLNELFAHPVLVDFAIVVDSHSNDVALPAITLADRQLPLPLSFAQQRLWFLAQMEGVSEAYHIHGGVKLVGELDRGILSATLNRIVARHEALRTTFIQHEGQVIQLIGDVQQGGMSLEVVDLQHSHNPAVQQAQLQQALEAASSASFDLENGPLIRACLVQLSAQEHVLYITMHHIISDGWSLGVLMNEVSALYEAYRHEGSDHSCDPLPPLAIQYPDYADWQRHWLSGDQLQQQADYWLSNLSTAPALLELPTDRPRPLQQSFAGASHKVVFNKDLTSKLKTLSQRHGVTLFMTLLSSWGTLLGRLSGQDDIVIGSPIAGRNRHETENLIGFFVNTLALRLNVDGNQRVADILAHSKQQVLAAQQYQDLPFEQVVDLVKPPRSLSYSPIFQVMFAWQNTPEGALTLPGLELTPVELEARTTAKFDLTLALQEVNGEIQGILDYATSLFDESTIARYVGHWSLLLDAMVEDDQRTLADLPLLSQSQRNQLLVEWNATEKAYPQDRCIHELFEQQAEQTPDATALVFEQESVTYAELNHRANQLAHHLREQGVVPDSRVAICLERGIDMVVALFATLKAGGAYVPLDPAYPVDRLVHMLTDSTPVVCLVHAPTKSLVLEIGGENLVDLDRQQPLLSEQPCSNPAKLEVSTAHDIAYVLYTSGSTGKPKGVMVTHRNLMNFMATMEQQPGMASGDVLLNVTSLSFDIAALEIFLPLLCGARTILTNRLAATDPQQLTELIAQHHVSVLQATPSTWRMLVEYGWPAQARNLKIMVGGEALPADLAHDLLNNVPCVWNMYGPTETTIWSTLHCIKSIDEGITIGNPIANTRLYILDSKLQPVPQGVSGELFIGGDGVTRGYLNRPELTVERFLSDPFVEDTSARMYKTGDLCRYRADGKVEYLGRNDFQVKIRGFRIELGEIETKLNALDSVREAAVVARDDVGSEKSLVAYAVMREGHVLDVTAMRAALAEQLPQYMLPSAFVQLTAMPLTPNGKLDRKALPAPEGDAYISQVYEAPAGETEIAVATIWASLLKKEQVGRHDNFFDLGGHSLLAVQLLSRIRQSLNVDVSLNELFAHPVLTDFATVVDSHSNDVALPAITLADRQLPLPLSFAQQRLWFLAQMEGVSEAYHIHGGVKLVGELDRGILSATLNRIVARHEALRTTFIQHEGQVIQLIGDISSGQAAHGMALEVVDLQNVEPSVQHAQLQQTLEAASSASFDLENGPLIRACLVQLSAQEHVLYITMHHIISDGWSLGVLMNEVSALYEAYRHEGSDHSRDPLPPLAIQYPDYADWQRHWLSGEQLQQQADYWLSNLSNAPALLELPTDRPRPLQQSFAGASHKVSFNKELTGKLKTLSQHHGVTLFMTLLSSWGTLLGRLSGQDDIVIGSPIAGRNRHETENLIGFFVNTLALRLNVDGNQRVADLLAHSKQQVLAAQQYQDLPFEQVVDLVKPPRSLSYSPIFQVMFAWQNTPEGALTLPGLELSPVELESRTTAKFDLTLTLQEINGEIRGTLDYATSLFDESTIARYVGHWSLLLDAMVEDDQRTLADLPLLSQSQRNQLLVEWNNTHVDYPQDRCIHELFEQQAEQTPDATALVFEGEQVTYAQLNEQANRLAHYLREQGVAPDSRVAICVERSIEMVVALFATLKAGGAYVPLDPGYPEHRLAHMLNDSAPSVVLVDAVGQEALSGIANVTSFNQIHLQDDAWIWATEYDTNPEPGLALNNLAYIIYTSGSTGLPKGAMNEHAGILNRLVWMQEAYGLTDQDVVLQKTPFSFDVSVWEFFWPLMYGATLAIAKPDGHKDPAYLRDLIEREGVTTMHFVPSMLQVYLEQEGISASNLKRVICSGEALSTHAVKRFHEQIQGVSLINLYGPTEAAVDVTEWVCDPEETKLGYAIPIGRPIANTRIYLLDAHLQPVPVGVSGELYIGGVQVGRGYLNRDELTAERFLKDPFCVDENGRMYRTGDLARYRADGTIDYLGRNDFQVKIRGFRIELGEIEAKLAALDNIVDVAVIARDDNGDKRLVAYVTTRDQQALDVAQIRTALAADLSDYMIPAAFVQLDALPVTPNGKLDRKALPAPEGDAYISQVYEAPVGETEIAVSVIWASLLKKEQVGRHDNFFDLGGHSLLAVQLLSRIRQSLSVEVTLNELFAHPVLADFAAVVDSHSNDVALPAITLADRQLPLPLSFAQQRLWFLAQMEGVSEAYHIHGGVKLVGELDRGILSATLNRIVARHESLRTTFIPHEGQVIQTIGDTDVGMELQVQDLQHCDPSTQQAQLQQALEAASSASFDLENGPLIRACLVQLSAQEHVLYITMHHIISDGWSLGVLMNEVSALYEAYRHEGSDHSCDPLPALAIQYPDYADWQRHWLSGDQLQQQADYWLSNLSTAPALLELPTDRPRPLQQSFAGASHKVTFNRDLTTKLKTLSQRHGVTLFMTLLSSWGTLLGRLSGQDDIVIGSPIAGRNRHETENLIGFFVNTLALRLNVDGNQRVADLLAHSKQQVLAAQQYQDLPFEQVVDLVKPPRSLSYSPIFQVMFAWQNTPEGALTLPGLELTPVELEARTTAKFDLTLTLQESNGEISGTLDYATSLFDESTIARYVGHWSLLLDAMVEDDQRTLSDLPLLSQSQRNQLLVEWNNTEKAYSQDRCIHELFEQQVEQTPDATALVFEGEQVTYAELNEQANRLAHYLREQGVVPDSRVAICVERSIEMVVALFATLKAGGAYVPLDPGYPEHCLAHMLNDSAPSVVLVDAVGQDALSGIANATSFNQIHLQDDAWIWATEYDTNPEPGLSLNNLAYIIYTSGSTGLPKGAMNEHVGILNRLVWMQEAYQLNHSDVVLQKTPFSFDVSVWEFFWPLMYGATLAIAKPDGHKDPAYLRDLIEREGVTTLHFVPSMLQVFLEQLGEQDGIYASNLKRVICSGEALSTHAVKRFHEQIQGVSLINLYGPTEAAVDVTEWVCEANTTGYAIPIGRPIANTRIYLLDAHLQPVPVGVSGELYIGGVQVGRGYLNRDELTAERFLKDPFSVDENGRMYRTGDLARYRADGTIDYLGRNDFQVKIRGFRIELGEIEAKLAALENIVDVAVIARDDNGDKRLVAYVTTRDAQPLDVAQVRAALAADLSDYMIPGAFVQLDALPVTPNGKLDRNALPAPEGDAYISQVYEAPVGETEIAVAAIWAALLKQEQVGRHDNFFDLGGHSLLAVQLLSRIRQSLNVEVTLNELFAHPVLVDFASVVDSHSNDVALPAITLADRQLPLPLSFAQQRLWFLAQMEGVSEAYHIHGGVKLVGELDRGILSATLNCIVARHESLRTTFIQHEGQVIQLIGDVQQGGMALEVVDLQHSHHPHNPAVQQAQLQQALEAASSARFDLENGPLIRACLVQLSAQEHVLYITMHHIISDGWSLGVLMNEVSALYEAYRHEGSDHSRDPLPPLAIQYPDYADWQRHWLSGDQLQQQADYWLSNLSTAPALLELPTDRPRPLQQSFAGASHKVTFNKDLTSKLKTLSQRHGVTLFMTLLSSWGTLLGRLSGQDDIVIGSPIAGRNRHETENLIGFFVNTLALRLNVDGTQRVADILAHSKQQVLAAQQYQDLPFEQVVDLVKPPRSLSYAPIFQVMFAWQNTPEGALTLPGLELTPVELESRTTAKFDLTLALQEVDGEIQGILDYATALFDETTIQRYIGHWELLLLAMVEDDQTTLADLPLLSQDQRNQLLVEWNNTHVDYPQDRCIHELFEQQVEQTPDAIALVFEGKQVIYSELNARANQLAHHLVACGVQAGEYLALTMDRSIELVIAELAVLKVGGIYVPLDQALPDERQNQILTNCGARWMLTHGHNPKVAYLNNISIIDIAAPDIRAEAPGNLDVKTDPTSAVYVMYTSGSTGQSKGVVVPHTGVSRLIFNNGFADFRSSDRVAFVANPAFDASTLEVWAPLLTGGCCVIIPQKTVFEPKRFAEELRDKAVNVMFLTIGLFNQYHEELASVIPQLRYLMTGGDVLDPRIVKKVLLNNPPQHLLSAYGPTETTTFATTYEIGVGYPEKTSIPLGRPIGNTQIYILDKQRQPVPIGVAGELYIGGPGVALGYLNQADLTAERFIVDPFSQQANARMYKTGDLGKWSVDGNIEFLGRNDFQVKIRGFRIELGEIETQLAQVPGVQNLVVLARVRESTETGKDKKLVAYYTGEVETLALRDHARNQLPPYMVPEAYVKLDRLPLTPNGKIDRKALPAPEVESYVSQDYEAPQGEVEITLSQIWSRVLKQEKVGRHDNFFDLGGHSLLAVSLIEHMRQAGFHTDVQAVFMAPSLAELALHVQDSTIIYEQVLPPPNLIPEFVGNDLTERLLNEHAFNKQAVNEQAFHEQDFEEFRL